MTSTDPAVLALDWTTFLVPASAAAPASVVCVVQNAQNVSAEFVLAGVGGLSTPIVMQPHTIQTIVIDLSRLSQED